MFQTEPILFLQGLASGSLTWLVATVSSMGHAGFFVVVVGGVLLAVDLRRGLVLAQIVIWTNLVTDIAKWGFGLPRPTDVDAAVIDPRSGRGSSTPWLGRGGRDFLAPLDGDVVSWFRAGPSRSYGFPSGHVSTTTALWGGLTILFARRSLLVGTVVLVPAMAFARMYLGRHFLADVLGGAVVGGTLVLVARELLVRQSAPLPVLRTGSVLSLVAWQRVGTVAWLVGAPLALLPFGGVVDRQRIGHLLGLNLAYLALSAGGIPPEAGGFPRALARAALGGVIGVSSWTVVGWSVAVAGLEGGAPAVRLTGGAISTFLLLWGTVTVGRRVGLYLAPGLTPSRAPAPAPSHEGGRA